MSARPSPNTARPSPNTARASSGTATPSFAKMGGGIVNMMPVATPTYIRAKLVEQGRLPSDPFNKPFHVALGIDDVEVDRHLPPRKWYGHDYLIRGEDGELVLDEAGFPKIDETKVYWWQDHRLADEIVATLEQTVSGRSEIWFTQDGEARISFEDQQDATMFRLALDGGAK